MATLVLVLAAIYSRVRQAIYVDRSIVRTRYQVWQYSSGSSSSPSTQKQQHTSAVVLILSAYVYTYVYHLHIVYGPYCKAEAVSVRKWYRYGMESSP